MSRFFTGDHNTRDLRGRVVRNGFIAMTSRVVTGVVQVVTTIALARLLAPDDWGLVAIVFALTSVAPMLIDLGLGDATVQKATITPPQINALFWLNMALGCALALILLLAAPLVASMYRQPALKGIMAVFAITFVLNSLAVQHLALLRRTLRFNDIAIIEITGCIGGAAVAIVMAVFGAGYWALVVRSVATALLTATLAWIRCGWRPGLPAAAPGLKSMLRFGLHVTVGAVAILIGNAVDRLALGLMYAPRLVGFYQNGLTIFESAALAIAVPLQQVGISALSRLQDDSASFKQKYAAALSAASFYSMPAFAVLAVIGQDLLPFLLGEKWAPAGVVLSILALRGIVHIIESSQMWLHLPLGNGARWVRWGLFTVFVQVAAVGIGLPFGIEGVAASIVIARGALAVPSVIYAGRPLGINLRTVLGAVGRQFSAAIIALLLGKALLAVLPLEVGRFSRIALATTMCAVIYFSVVVLVFGLRDPLLLTSSFLKKLVPERFHSWLPFAAPAPSISPE